jgi:hypothetical protein
MGLWFNKTVRTIVKDEQEIDWLEFGKKIVLDAANQVQKTLDDERILMATEVFGSSAVKEKKVFLIDSSLEHRKRVPDPDIFAGIEVNSKIPISFEDTSFNENLIKTCSYIHKNRIYNSKPSTEAAIGYLKKCLGKYYREDADFIISNTRPEHWGPWMITRVIEVMANLPNLYPFERHLRGESALLNPDLEIDPEPSFERDMEQDILYGFPGNGILVFLDAQIIANANMKALHTIDKTIYIGDNFNEMDDDEVKDELNDDDDFMEICPDNNALIQRVNDGEVDPFNLEELDNRKREFLQEIKEEFSDNTRSIIDLPVFWSCYANGPSFLQRQTMLANAMSVLSNKQTKMENNTAIKRASRFRDEVDTRLAEISWKWVLEKDSINSVIQAWVSRIIDFKNKDFSNSMGFERLDLLDFVKDVIRGAIKSIFDNIIHSKGIRKSNIFRLVKSDCEVLFFSICLPWPKGYSSVLKQDEENEDNLSSDKVWNLIEKHCNNPDKVSNLTTVIKAFDNLPSQNNVIIKLCKIFYIAKILYASKNEQLSNWFSLAINPNNFKETFFSALRLVKDQAYLGIVEAEPTVKHNWSLPSFPLTVYDRLRNSALYKLKYDLQYTNLLELGLLAPESLVRIPYINLYDVSQCSLDGLSLRVDWAIENIEISDKEANKRLSNSDDIKSLVEAGVCFDLIREFSQI